MREIPLLVTTVTIPSATDMMPPQPKRRRLLPENGIDKLLKESKGWVLDFDLDFFSTGNPYRGPFTSVSGCGVCVCVGVCVGVWIWDTIIITLMVVQIIAF